MDQPEAASKNIKKIINDISQSLQAKKEELKRTITALKDRHSSQVKEASNENSNLISLFEEINRESVALNSRKNLIRKSLDKEETELIKLDKENQEFLAQMNELEALNRSFKERKDEFDEKFKVLQSKNQNMRERLQIKNKDQKSINEAYKKYLGLEIVKIRENVVKIQFNNFSSDYYCVLDFTRDDCVSECFPDMNLERLNYLFKERKSFYEFIKYLRDQFKQKS